MDFRKFDETVDSVLMALHKEFPTHIAIDPTVIGLSDEQPNRTDHRQPSHTREWHAETDYVESVVQWLHNEAYIFGNLGNKRFSLTSKGYALLSSMDSSVVIPRILRV